MPDFSSVIKENGLDQKDFMKYKHQIQLLISEGKSQEEAIKQVTEEHKYQSPIRLIPFANFKQHGEIPRLGLGSGKFANVPSSDLTVDLRDVDRVDSFIIFVSHSWLASWSGEDNDGNVLDSITSENWRGYPHTDTNANDKFKLIVEAIEKLWRNQASLMQHCFIWLDFSCINQNDNPARELNGLVKIMEISDCILTPVMDQEHDKWDYPSDGCVNDYTQYAAPRFSIGPYAYTNRAWCRLEMLYAASIPLQGGNTGRLEKFTFELKQAAEEGRRPHFVYGSKDSLMKLLPIMLPPLTDAMMADLSPEQAIKEGLTVFSDNGVIHRLMDDLHRFRRKGAHTKVVNTYHYSFCSHPGLGDGDDENKSVCSAGSNSGSLAGFRDIQEGQEGQDGHHLNANPEGVDWEDEDDEDKIYIQTNHLISPSEGLTELQDKEKRERKEREERENREIATRELERIRAAVYNNTDIITNSGRTITTTTPLGLTNVTLSGKGTYTWADGTVYEGDYVGDKMHGRGKYTKANGNFYEGEWVQDKRHGHGVYSRKDGEVYDGEWGDNKKHGYGVLTKGPDNWYKGEWVDDKRHGKGMTMRPNGDTHEGMYVDNMKHGIGRSVFTAGDVYDGEYNKDQQHGYGVCTYSNGDKYEGNWVYNMIEGMGKFTHECGDFYEGSWKNDQMSGFGKYTRMNGDIYEGYWAGGKRHGKGSVTRSSKHVYSGEWNMDTRHGHGKYTRANGDVYEGAYVLNNRHGMGHCKFATGDVYEGQYKDDMEHGEGTCIYACGNVYEGSWVHGKRHGTGKVTYTNGDIYEGQYRQNKRYHGKLTYVTDSTYIGYWLNGNRHGNGRYTRSNGNVYDGEWREDKIHGKGKYTRMDGTAYEGDWVDEQRDGRGTLSYANGNVYEGEFKNNLRQGFGKYTRACGDVYEGEYYEDKRHGRGTVTDAVTGESIEADWFNDEPDLDVLQVVNEPQVGPL